MKASLPLAVIILMAQSSPTTQALPIPSTLSCPQCGFQWDTVAVLKNVATVGSLLGRDNAGRYYLGDPDVGRIRVFGAQGDPVRSMGRKGGGPGEFERIRNLLVTGDGSVMVLDPALSRATEFAADGRLIRSASVNLRGSQQAAVLMRNGDIVTVLPAIADGPNSAGTTPALFRVRVGERDPSPLSGAGSYDPRTPWLTDYIFFQRRSGELLVVKPYSNLIEQFSETLERRTLFRRDAEWALRREPAELPSDGLFDKPYVTRFRDIWEDEARLVWTVTTVASPQWTPEPPVRMESAGDRARLERLSARPRVEYIIEVLDLERRQVVARQRLKERLGVQFGGGYFARTVVSPGGATEVVVRRIHLERVGGT